MLKKFRVFILVLFVCAQIFTISCIEDADASIGPVFPNMQTWKKDKNWVDIYKLIDEQKYTKALELVEGSLKKFINARDEKNWTIALLTKQNLLNGLHNVERSVNEFKAAKWPQSLSSQILLNLYYAQTLRNYYQYYSWEINKREEVVTLSKVDLKKWTRGQIFNEIQKSLLTIWERREEMGVVTGDHFKAFISEGSYPKDVRGTIRDIYTYFYVAFLKDTSFWSARHSNEKSVLEVSKLLAIKKRGASKNELLNPETSPVVKISAILADLEKWHWDNDRLSSLMEARFERIRFYKSHYIDDKDKKELDSNLKTFLRDFKIDRWWSEGMYLRAQLVYEMSHQTAHMEAMSIATLGRDAFPSSIGGGRCNALVERIKAPKISMKIRRFDAKEKRSIEVSYSNWNRIYFKAYRIDHDKYIIKQKDYYIYPNRDAVLKIVKESKPEFEWKEELQVTGDFKEHKEYLTPKIDKRGAYIILASAKEGFPENKNKVVYGFYQQTDLFLLKDTSAKAHDFRVSSASNNEAISGATIKIYKLDWRNGHSIYKTLKTNKEGVATLKRGNGENLNVAYSVVYKKDKLFDLDQKRLDQSLYENRKVSKSSLVFTDRSIFRPGQVVNFKVITYENRNTLNQFPKTRPNRKITVSLFDSNRELVQTLKLKTNEFASTSGQFNLPTSGRALGGWSIKVTGYHGSQNIRVEEYKRPTFITEIKDSVSKLKLNEKAQFKGNAKYFFGMPVANAKVKTVIRRTTYYPYWYYWWYPARNQQSQIVFTGESKTDEKGDFFISFLPKAPKDSREKELKYRYSISVDILNEGGETAQANKSFFIGSIAVSANISKVKTFNEKGIGFNINRVDLNGKPLPGKGKYKVFSLKNPRKTLSPTDQPLYFGSKSPLKNKLNTKYSTKGDFLRSRWNPESNSLKILKNWEKEKLVEESRISHNTYGVGSVELKNLKPGAYRIVYETKDAFEQEFKTQEEFIILNNKSKLNLPLELRVDKQDAHVGDMVKFFIHSGYEDQNLNFEIFHFNKLVYSKRINSNKKKNFLKFKIKDKYRGGLTVRLYGIRDYIVLSRQLTINIPYVEKNLAINLERIRKIIYPGQKETWTIGISGFDKKGKKKALKEKAEVLAYMYDKSLDTFVMHNTPSFSMPSAYLNRYLSQPRYDGRSHQLGYWWYSLPSGQSLYMNRINILNAYSIGGMGRRGGFGGRGERVNLALMDSASSPVKKRSAKRQSMKEAVPMESGFAMDEAKSRVNEFTKGPGTNEEKAIKKIRTNFSETAFFKPHLLTKKNGDVKLSFTVPDSLTSWNVWAHAVTKDFQFGSNMRTIESKKDLMVRSYFPRFLRQSDKVNLKIVVNNGGEKKLTGKFKFVIFDSSDVDISKELKLDQKYILGDPFSIKSGESLSYTVSIHVPVNRLGQIKLKAFAEAGNFTDGEEKELNILPSRVHLAQSKFLTLKDKEKREIIFNDMIKQDKSLVHDSLVVKLDGQLFYSLLTSLPYIKDYPYVSSDQTLNTYVTASILGEAYSEFPKIAEMAKKMSTRKTKNEAWNEKDPNRKLSLEETPWLEEARGGASEELLNSLRPEVVKALRKEKLSELLQFQTAIGGFSWFKGGPPSLQTTIYILNGFSRVSEFGGTIPKSEIQKAWGYVESEYRKMISWCIKHNSCYEAITFINFSLSSYSDKTYFEQFFPESLRKEMLEFSFKHWKRHSPQLKGMLSLTLSRMDRSADAKLVFGSVMDSAKTEKDLGTYWAPEEKSWLWYNDTIETQAYTLRTLMEVMPNDKRSGGLVQWLYLNKKMGHWKSTRATSEVIYSVLYYLKKKKMLSSTEEVSIKMGSIEKDFKFNPEEYKGKDNFIVLKGDQIKPQEMHKITAQQKTKGISFVSATWHYSTEKIPSKAKGDLLAVKRVFFKREVVKNKVVLKPLSGGEEVRVGDQIEVQLSFKAKHEAEYIHLMDPRPSGFEPEASVSRYRWDLGVIRFEEVRDSGMNFFIEKLPVGEYVLKHRLRANISGIFRTHPAKLQSLYAPEFNAFSSGKIIEVKE